MDPHFRVSYQNVQVPERSRWRLKFGVRRAGYPFVCCGEVGKAATRKLGYSPLLVLISTFKHYKKQDLRTCTQQGRSFISRIKDDKVSDTLEYGATRNKNASDKADKPNQVDYEAAYKRSQTIKRGRNENIDGKSISPKAEVKTVEDKEKMLRDFVAALRAKLKKSVSRIGGQGES